MFRSDKLEKLLNYHGLCFINISNNLIENYSYRIFGYVDNVFRVFITDGLSKNTTERYLKYIDIVEFLRETRKRSDYCKDGYICVENKYDLKRKAKGVFPTECFLAYYIEDEDKFIFKNLWQLVKYLDKISEEDLEKNKKILIRLTPKDSNSDKKLFLDEEEFFNLLKEKNIHSKDWLLKFKCFKNILKEI